jgi:signal transduction histidine kinase
VALIDDAGIVQRCNRAMTSILNRSYVSVEGVAIDALVRECFEVDLLRDEHSPVQEAQVDTRYFRFSITPVITNEVQSGSIFIVSEITEQKRAQAAFVINERLAATGRMANTIAHEINNPLEAITNLLYLLGGALDQPETAAQYLASTQEQLSRVSRIVRQILSFNRESSSPVPVHLYELLEDVLALNNRAIVEKNLQVIKHWNEATVIHGYPAQLRQVFSNLLRNAVEASSPGKRICLRISACHQWSKQKEPSARITFSDEGVGIPTRNVDRIFEAFFTTKELKGSGVGLWLSSTIIQEHQGHIQVRSSTRPGQSGTCISVLLPCKFPDNEPPTSTK